MMTNNVHADSYVSSADSKKDVKGRSSNVKEDDFSLDGTNTTTGQVLVQDEDARLLARIGYKQELRREFNKWSTVSYAISVLGVLGSQPATYGVPISVGGPATAVWAWFIGSFMAYAIASSVAELVSAYPTAGGMYFVTKHVVPEEHVAIWAWIIGWCNFLGQAAGVASLAYTIGQMILAGASMNSGLLGDGYQYSPTPSQTVAVAITALIIFGSVCSLPTKNLHRIVLWFAPINVLATVAICIALPLSTPDLRSWQFVFTDFHVSSGYSSIVFSFLLGFLSVAWVMTDYDGTTHMSEETHDAAVRGPLAIRLAVAVSGALGFGLNIAFTFCLPLDYSTSVLDSPTGLPVAQLFLNAGGPAGGTVMLCFVIIVQFFTGCSAMLANARMAYAFARDDALPYSHIWSQVSTRTGTPVKAVWFVVLFCACLNLIGLGSTQTITGIFNVCAPCLDLSYIAVIVAHLYYSHLKPYLAHRFPNLTFGKPTSTVIFVPGPYTLPRWRKYPTNIIAVIWVLFISVGLFFPTTKPVTAANMNYAIAIAGVVGLFAVGWWFAGARNKYVGPRTKDLGVGEVGEG